MNFLVNQWHRSYVRFLDSLALVAGLVLVGCQAGAVISRDTLTPTATPTPWPTLAPVGTVSATLTPPFGITPVLRPAGPQLVDQFRVTVLADAVSAFPLEGTELYPVRIEVIVLDGDLDPEVTLNNAQGDRLAYSNSGGVGEPEVIGQFQFPADGYYELGIGAVTGSGSVGVSIYQIDTTGLQGGGTFTAPSQDLYGSITQPSTYQTFRLQAQRGERFDLAAIAQTEGLDLVFELYGPDGALLAARDDNIGKDPYLWNFMPSQSGIYTVVVSNFDQTVGDYILRLSPSVGGDQAVIASRTEIELVGAPRRSVWLTLAGRALDGVYVEARPVTAGVDPTIAFYDPFGNRLTAVDEFGPGETESLTAVQFPVDGVYQVEFETVGEGGSVQYYIRPINQIDLDEGGGIVPGGVGRVGTINGPGTVYAYLFDAQAGDLLGIDAHATSSTGLDLGFDLFAPDGSLIMSLDDTVGKNPVVDRFEVSQSGQYTLAVWNYGSTTGTFAVFVNTPEAAAMPGQMTAPTPTP